MRRSKYLTVLAISAALLCASPPAFAAAPITITLSGVTTGSGQFPYAVSLARLLSTYCPAYSFIVAESGGSLENTQKIRSGKIRMGCSVAYIDGESYFGRGVYFRDKPFRDTRILWYYQRAMIQIVAAQDSGIRTLHDLDGRSFSAGGTGTASSSIIYELFDILDIHPQYYESGQIEASDAYVNGKIDGVVKIGPVPDNYITYLNDSRPVRFLTLSQEDMDKVLKHIPSARIFFLPKDAYGGVDYDVRCLISYHGIQTDTSFSQEEGYRFFKAMWEDGRVTWQRAYPSGKDNDVPDMTLKAAMTPLHPGTVQYLEEHGYHVPKKLIPAEYVPVP